MAIERDRVTIFSGVRGGVSLGSPVAMMIRNRDWPNWRGVMDPEPGVDAGPPIRRPRPGHVDLAASMKYGYRDLRDGLERASARETAARVAAGALASALLGAVGIRVISWTAALGEIEADPDTFPSGDDPGDLWSRWRAREEETALRCPDPASEAEMTELIDRAAERGDTLGGVVEARVLGVPPGLGSHVQSDRRLDGRLAGAVASIQGIKAVEIGAGFAGARSPGSRVHDEIHPPTPGDGVPSRPTNRAGGIEGGITNGQPVVVRAHMKPIATLGRSMASIDLDTGSPIASHHERSDVCAVPAAGVVVEAAVALCVADALTEKFGADTLAEILASLQRFREGLR